MNISKDLIVILVIALVIFGSSRLVGLGSDLGKMIRDFRKSMEEPDSSRSQLPPSDPPSRKA